jgi:hypothetical protein
VHKGWCEKIDTKKSYIKGINARATEQDAIAVGLRPAEKNMIKEYNSPLNHHLSYYFLYI